MEAECPRGNISRVGSLQRAKKMTTFAYREEDGGRRKRSKILFSLFWLLHLVPSIWHCTVVDIQQASSHFEGANMFCLSENGHDFFLAYSI